VGKEEEKKGVEKQDETSKREEERREADAGEQEGIEETRSEVRDCTLSPTARAASDTTKQHEPARFDWASEVDDFLGLSPVAHNTSQPVPIIPIPCDVPIDPVRTGFANAAPSKPSASAPASPDLAPPKRTTNSSNGDVVACACIPAASAPSDRTPAASVLVYPAPAAPILIDPDPGDNPINPNRTSKSATIPSAHPNLISIHPAFARAVLIDPDPNNMAIILVRIAFTNPVPSNSTPTLFVHPVPADSTTADSGPVTRVNTIDITPTEHVHVDPMSRTFITLLIRQALISASLLVYSTNFALASRTHMQMPFC
jgi:hypothetical protein